MAQGIFSSPQFVACIRFMKVIFSQTWIIPLLVFIEVSHSDRKFLSVFWLHVCIWRKMWRAAEESSGCLWASGGTLQRNKAYIWASSVPYILYCSKLLWRRAGFSHGPQPMQHTRVHRAVFPLSEASLAAVFIILTNRRMVRYFSDGSWLL